MRHFLVSLAVITVFLSMVRAEDSPNLLRNGDFSEWMADAPNSWLVRDKKQKIQQVTDANANGTKTALKVEVVVDGGTSLGEIRQIIKPSPGAKYHCEAMVRSSKPKIAFLMVKLKKQRQELTRLNTGEISTAEWKAVSIDFEAGDADEIEVSCRYKQTAGCVGSTCEFANVSLKKVE